MKTKNYTIWDKIANYFSIDIGLDLGTANVVVYIKDKGIVANEPSVVAVQRDRTGDINILAVGDEAKLMIGKTPGSIEAIRPLKEGVIADFEVTQKMLEYFISKYHKNNFLVRPRVVVSVPIGITPVEKRAVVEAAESAGAREVYLIEETMAAALGAEMDSVLSSRGGMIIDIGGGTTGISVISLGGLVLSKSIKTAGDSMNNAIIDYVKKTCNILIGENMAETVKKTIADVSNNPSESLQMQVRGRSLEDGLPTSIDLRASDTKKALDTSVDEIISAVRETLDLTPPELAGDIIVDGIVLAGGGALLGGLAERISSSTKLKVSVGEDPLLCVVNGCGKALEEINTLRKISI
ncbi:MAG: rod shape-determining protein [Deltaproteobacteria bacterium TMED126]|nr:rod shape-determining protein [Deltaproteobacteria bacterium TMED126]|tara:strand:+ start:26619 stop:27674 length:1056 start_codon:yes stop_codon:yes gene_type:complete